MARYLSGEWFEEINAAARAGAAPPTATGGRPVVLQQLVTGGPDGDVAYWVRVGDGTLEAGLGRAEDPDVTVGQSYDTALAVSTGELSAQAAFLAGRIRVSGDPTALLPHQAVLQELDRALALVRRRTTPG